MVYSRATFKKLFPALLLICLFQQPVKCEGITLAKNGKARYEIFSMPQANEIESFTVQELKKYLDNISGVTFRYSEKPVKQMIIPARSIRVKTLFTQYSIPVLENDQYGIYVRKGSIFLAGGTDRSTLYAVYHFLKMLGCKWIAPDFAFYEGTSSYIPRKDELNFKYINDIREKLMTEYCNSVYGQFSETALTIYNEAEKIVRFGCDMPFLTVKSAGEYNDYSNRLILILDKIKGLRERKPDTAISNNLFRLNIMMEYALKRSMLMMYRTENDEAAAVKAQSDIDGLLDKYADNGVFVFKRN